jgi:predicted ribosomally synthesized peptide with nif11-like leader
MVACIAGWIELPHTREFSMSVQQALNFIQNVRAEPPAPDELQRQMIDGSLEGLVSLAKSRGFDCTAEELRRAHRMDWSMRWQRLNSGKSGH